MSRIVKSDLPALAIGDAHLATGVHTTPRRASARKLRCAHVHVFENNAAVSGQLSSSHGSGTCSGKWVP